MGLPGVSLGDFDESLANVQAGDSIVAKFRQLDGKVSGPGATSETSAWGGSCFEIWRASALKSSSAFLVRLAYHLAMNRSIPSPVEVWRTIMQTLS